MTIRNVFLFFVVMFLIAACGSSVPTLQPQRSPVQMSPLASPLPTASAVMPFTIERPLLPGATEVRGTGPAGVPVFVADVTFMGESLGVGTIGPDGKFVIAVKPLEPNHRIGLALGVLNGTAWSLEDFQKQQYNGPEAMQVPLVGFFYDTLMISQP